MADSKWEFEAPQFVDFGAGQHCENDNADEFFDRIDDFNDGLVKEESDILTETKVKEDKDTENIPTSLPTSSPSKKVFNIKDDLPLPSTTVESALLEIQNFDRRTFSVKTPAKCSNVVKKETNKPEIAKLSFDESKVLKNVVTPSRLASWNTKKVVAQKPKSRDLKKCDTKDKFKLRRSLREISAANDINGPPQKRQKNNNSTKKPTRSGSVTIPHSHRPRQRIPTTEELQLNEIKQHQENLKRFKEHANKVFEKAGRHEVSNTKTRVHVTKPVEFHFKTDERAAKTHSMATRSDSSSLSHSDFVHGLRKYAPSPVGTPRKTVTEPFKFTAKKRKLELDAPPKVSEFVPLAKAVIDFHKNVSKHKEGMKGPLKAMRPTVPKTPKLTKSRNRPISTVSAKEKEEQELEEIKNYKFKAQPLNHAILDAPEQLKKVEKKSSTIPEEFHLATDLRSLKVADAEDVEAKPFKAQPIPAHLFEKATGLKDKKSIPITVPESPAFALKNRIKAPIRQTDTTEPTSLESVLLDEHNQPHTYYHTPPDHSHVFVPKRTAQKTQPVPFSFDSKDKERFAKKEEKIKEMKEKENEVATFKAQPMPLPESPSITLPPKHVKKPTKPHPPNLCTDERAATRVEQWTKQIESEIREMRDKTVFKANSSYEKVTKGKGWEPKKNARPPTAPLDVVLRSDVRAKKREEYEKEMQQIKEDAKKRELEEKQRQEALEQKELTELRRSMVPKAHNIRSYKSVEVLKSDKPLTIAESPKFSTRFKK